jgi:hypothetical protein
MNAEAQIAAYVAAVRGSDGPTVHIVASRRASTGHRAPAGKQNGQPVGFRPPVVVGGPVRDPWPDRPGIAGKIRRYIAAASKIAARRPVEIAAVSLLVAGATRVAVHLIEPTHPMIVKLMYYM